MRASVSRFVVLVLAAAGLVALDVPASAAPVAVELCAAPATLTLPGPVTVPVWGFGVPSTSGDCTSATPTVPGPRLQVDQGDTVTLTVRNALPPGHTLSFEVPGITFEPGLVDAAPGAARTITFTASRPGTYLYQSGGDSGRQEAMGLSGPLVVRPPVPTQAYDASTAFDVEATLVLFAVDPAFNAAPGTFDLLQFRPVFWLINGKAYPDTVPVTATAGQRVLLRYANAGFDNTAMQLLGTHQHVVARDARLLANPFDAATETIPAGATEDVIVTMPAVTAAPSASGFALYNRNLHVTNGPQAGASPDPLTGGGMLTFLKPLP